MNRLDITQFKALWMPQASSVIDPPVNFKFDGSRDDLAAAFEAGLRMTSKSFISLVHGSVVDITGATDRARTYIAEQDVRLDGGGQFLYGVYEDEVVRSIEGWRFAKRHFRYLRLIQKPIGGESAGIGACL